MARLSADYRDGVRDAVPIQIGLVPYGLVVGVAAVRVGLTTDQALGLSAALFAGASQLAAVDLLSSGAPLFVVVLTAAVINLRIMLFSASIAPYLQKYRLRWRVLFAAFLVGMAYARSIAEFQEDDAEELDHGWYFFGIASSLYAVWLVTTLVGVVVGTGIPANLGITFVVPLVFLSMAISSIKDRPTLAASVVGGAVAIAVAWLPMRLNLVVAGVIGIVAGLLADRYVGGGDR